MTGDELNTQLGFRMEDTGESIFTKQQKVDAINNAMRQVVALVDNKYLPELERRVSAGTEGAGDYVSYSNLWSTEPYHPARHNIVAVIDISGGREQWMTIIDNKDIKKMINNAYLTGTTENPIAFFFDERVYLRPKTMSDISVWYITQPTLYDYSSASSMATECELNAILEPVVLDLAEAELWRSDGDVNRANSAMQNGMSVIQVLNGRVDADTPNREIN